MDWRNINFALDYLASTGTAFSTEHRVAIQSSLAILQRDSRLQSVHFIGKINGTENDYYIVCGIGKDFLNDRKYFYSINGVTWILLPSPSEEILKLGQAASGHFTGDPSADSEVDIPNNGTDEMTEGEDWVTIKEEERLSATVVHIVQEGAVVPRGVLIKDPSGFVMENKMFSGLSKTDASQYHSYYHLRKPKNPWDANIVGRADYNLSLDFLDSISTDVPLGCWSIQIDSTETTAIIRSLYWPGLVSFHILDTCQYGWLYIGPGKKNWDVPFMILPPPGSARASIPSLQGSGDGQHRKTSEQQHVEPATEEYYTTEDEEMDGEGYALHLCKKQLIQFKPQAVVDLKKKENNQKSQLHEAKQ